MILDDWKWSYDLYDMIYNDLYDPMIYMICDDLYDPMIYMIYDDLYDQMI